jgi:hypothetical protein
MLGDTSEVIIKAGNALADVTWEGEDELHAFVFQGLYEKVRCFDLSAQKGHIDAVL